MLKVDATSVNSHDEDVSLSCDMKLMLNIPAFLVGELLSSMGNSIVYMKHINVDCLRITLPYHH